MLSPVLLFSLGHEPKAWKWWWRGLLEIILTDISLYSRFCLGDFERRSTFTWRYSLLKTTDWDSWLAKPMSIKPDLITHGKEMEYSYTCIS